MREIILSGGRVSSMKSLTNSQPKCLVKLRVKALLDWQLNALRAARVSDISIVTGYKREPLSERGLVEFHETRWHETNMVSSLACAESWLLNEPCIMSYSDIFYSSDAINSLVTCPEPLAITYDPEWVELWTKRFGDPLLDAETFRIKPDNTLAEIGNKPKRLDEVQGQYMGLLKFTPHAWAELSRIRAAKTPQLRDKMHMTETLQNIIQAGRIDITALPYSGEWGEFDSAEDLSVFNK